MKTLGRTLLTVLTFIGLYLIISFAYGFVKGILGDVIITWLDIAVIFAASVAGTICVRSK